MKFLMSLIILCGVLANAAPPESDLQTSAGALRLLIKNESFDELTRAEVYKAIAKIEASRAAVLRIENEVARAQAVDSRIDGRIRSLLNEVLKRLATLNVDEKNTQIKAYAVEKINYALLALPKVDLVDLLTDSNSEKVLNSSKYVVVEMGAEWCGYCRLEAPVFSQMSFTYAKRHDIKFARVDTDSSPELRASYCRSGIPFIGIFKDGKLLAGDSGYLDTSELKDYIERNTRR